MATHLEHLARRLEDDPFFLACPLKLHADSEGLDDDRLAAGLGCSMKSLLSLRLCRAPTEHESFQKVIERIAARFSANAEALTVVVRRGQALFQMAKSGQASSTLLAARDSERDENPRGKK
jgi:hypothetical protein